MEDMAAEAGAGVEVAVGVGVAAVAGVMAAVDSAGSSSSGN